MHENNSLPYFPFCWRLLPVIIIIIIVLNIIGHGSCYLIIITEDEPPGHVVFNTSLPPLGRSRHYKINMHRSASFVHQILHIDTTDGKVVLKRQLSCDGIYYPSLFTVYVDSVSNQSRGVDYYSLPLRIFVSGEKCDRDSGDYENSEFSSRIHTKISEAKRWISETFASYALPSADSWTGICLRKSQFVNSISSLLPLTVREMCHVRYVDTSDPRFRIETSAGDLVSADNQCIKEPLWKVTILMEFDCDNLNSEKEALGSGLVSSEHRLKIVYHHQDLNDTDIAHRVRRELRNQSPFFEQALYIASVMEEKPPGVLVTTVKARDPEHSPVSYSMVSLIDSRSQGMFAIDPGSGMVTTLTSLDRELMNLHYFQVMAMDDSFRPAINVLDANDHAPVFEASEYEASVRESVSIGSTVITLKATDQDIGRNAEVEYSILYPDDNSNSEPEAFRIDSKSGIITTRVMLDRERTEVYTLIVMATDQCLPVVERKSSTATVVVKVLDDNDNYPQFSERTYTLQVPEDINWSDNPVIASVRAVDADQGNNAALRYAIIGGNTQSQFSIDSITGDVSLVKPLDYELNRNYRLVQAYDADEGENAAIKYSLDMRNEDGELTRNFPLTIDEQSGWIHTSRELDREESARYHFVVVATDGGKPPKSATASVIITIQDVNDNDPVFEPNIYEAVVAEDDPPGTPVVSVTASDKDENSRCFYTVTYAPFSWVHALS
ncbi:hypothetical protein PR048_032568 [Dryococelus australis]|uniref:Cadherin domain-containing protein n=1 Tax=Dryococelus australis TaxID=614101 RepID=A0ABQ9G2K3_9NEOP|nr:hypothetical protein PR048_032568 [Dryococelus australis]